MAKSLRFSGWDKDWHMWVPESATWIMWLYQDMDPAGYEAYYNMIMSG